MVRDVHQQILFLEELDDRRQRGGHEFERRGCDGGLRYEDAGVEVVVGDEVDEGAHLFDADAGFRREFDPDRADGGGFGLGVGGRGRGVFLEHLRRGAGGEVHFLAAGTVRVRSQWLGLRGREGGKGEVRGSLGRCWTYSGWPVESAYWARKSSSDMRISSSASS